MKTKVIWLCSKQTIVLIYKTKSFLKNRGDVVVLSYWRIGHLVNSIFNYLLLWTHLVHNLLLCTLLVSCQKIPVVHFQSTGIFLYHLFSKLKRALIGTLCVVNIDQEWKVNSQRKTTKASRSKRTHSLYCFKSTSNQCPRGTIRSIIYLFQFSIGSCLNASHLCRRLSLIQSVVCMCCDYLVNSFLSLSTLSLLSSSLFLSSLLPLLLAYGANACFYTIHFLYY